MSHNGNLHVMLVVPRTREVHGASVEAIWGAARAGLGSQPRNASWLECVDPASEHMIRERLGAATHPTVLHFVGRGRINAAARYAVLNLAGSEGQPRPVNCRHLATFCRGVRLLVLQSADPNHSFAGFGPMLLEDGIEAVVTTSAMSNSELTALSQTLYGELAQGRSLREAHESARRRLRMLGSRVETELSAREPEARLFSAAPESRPASSSSSSSPPSPEKPALNQERTDSTGPGEVRAKLTEKRAAGIFDVFLCHNGADKDKVKAVAAHLKSQGILPWLDEWELPPGQPWRALLEAQMSRIRAAAVFVGRAGVGPWQEQEVDCLLRQFVARRLPVIPVLLPDATETPALPMFLEGMTWVDFRVNDPEPLARLSWGITGIRPSIVE